MRLQCEILADNWMDTMNHLRMGLDTSNSDHKNTSNPIENLWQTSSVTVSGTSW